MGSSILNMFTQTLGFPSPIRIIQTHKPTPRVVLEENQEGIDGMNSERMLVDLEGLEEEREVARGRS